MYDRLITSPRNPRLKEVLRLRNSRRGDRLRLCLIDGTRELRRALSHRVPVTTLFVDSSQQDQPNLRDITAQCAEKGAEVWQVEPRLFPKIAYGERHEGVVAIAESPLRELTTANTNRHQMVGVLVALEKPGNLGAIARSADAAGIEALILADPHTDPFHANCIRASLGTIFCLPVYRATSTESMAWLRACEFQIVTSRVDASMSYTEQDYRGRTALVLGSESQGLPADWVASDIRAVRIPMSGEGDSLNVSVTAALLFFEAQRQRQST